LRKILVILSLLLIIAVPLLAGCGSNTTKQTIDTDQGQITVEQGDQSSGVQMGDTKTDVGQEKEPTADDLGLPIYDGAEYVPGSGIPATITQGNTKYEMIVGEFLTSDPLNQVTDWYQGKLGEPGIKNQDEVSWSFRSNDGATTWQATLKTEDGKVKITLYKMTQVAS
jgi:hypothetical protein